MAAFCTCCGAEITLKAEACPVCGTPGHGALQFDQSLALGVDTDLSQTIEPVFRDSRDDQGFGSQRERSLPVKTDRR